MDAPHVTVADPVVLAPCARVGGPGDWWREQHVSCTRSHQVNDPVLGLVEFPCACVCHKPKGDIVLPTADERDARIIALELELAEARKQVEHWQANHAEQVRRKKRGVEIKDEIIAEQNREIAVLREQVADLKRRGTT